MKLEPFALERFQSIWENRVAWNLAESGVHPLTVAELADTAVLQEALLAQRLGYPQTNGSDALRQLIAAIYHGATADHIEVTNGGSEANCVLLMRLVQPGDTVIAMTPNYLQAAGLARALGATVKPWPLREEIGARGTRWVADLDELRRLAGGGARAILVCNPNNPTAACLDSPTLDEICRIASTAGAWVISDEIYRGAERGNEETPTMWGRYERAVVSSGLSKAYGLPGLRIGWIVAPPDLTSELWGIHDYTTIAPGGISDLLARFALEPVKRRALLARTRNIIRTNYDTVAAWLARHDGLTHAPPQAGAIVFVRYRHAIDSVELVTRLREERGVLVVPGSHFEMDGYLRIGFGADPPHLEQALEATGGFLDSILVHAR
jgi:aspartate/methionine/tyrosine aminotransferase